MARSDGQAPAARGQPAALAPVWRVARAEPLSVACRVTRRRLLAGAARAPPGTSTRPARSEADTRAPPIPSDCPLTHQPRPSTAPHAPSPTPQAPSPEPPAPNPTSQPATPGRLPPLHHHHHPCSVCCPRRAAPLPRPHSVLSPPAAAHGIHWSCCHRRLRCCAWYPARPAHPLPVHHAPLRRQRDLLPHGPSTSRVRDLVLLAPSPLARVLTHPRSLLRQPVLPGAPAASTRRRCRHRISPGPWLPPPALPHAGWPALRHCTRIWSTIHRRPGHLPRRRRLWRHGPMRR